MACLRFEQASYLLLLHLHHRGTVSTICRVRFEISQLIPSSPVAYTRFNGNPWVVRERNGLREYKQLGT